MQKNLEEKMLIAALVVQIFLLGMLAGILLMRLEYNRKSKTWNRAAVQMLHDLEHYGGRGK